MGPTSEGAAAAAASSCRVVAVAAVVDIAGWVVGPCRVLAASSSSTSKFSNGQTAKKKIERERDEPQ